MKYLELIGNEPIESPIGQIVLKQMAVRRALGLWPDPETVARDSYNVFLGNMQRQQLEISALKAQQAARRQREAEELHASVSSPGAAAPRVFTIPSKVSVRQPLKQATPPSELLVPGTNAHSELVDVKCPQCGRVKSIYPGKPQPGEVDAQGRRSVEAKCPNCGAVFKAPVKSSETMKQSTPAAAPVKETPHTHGLVVLRDSTRPPEDDGDLGGGFYASEVEAARHAWR